MAARPRFGQRGREGVRWRRRPRQLGQADRLVQKLEQVQNITSPAQAATVCAKWLDVKQSTDTYGGVPGGQAAAWRRWLAAA